MKISKLLFKASLVFLTIWIFGFTIGQKIPIEISDRALQYKFYYIGFNGIPISLALFIFSFIKKDDPISTKIEKIIRGILSATLAFLVLMHLIFDLGFGAWNDYNLLYENRNNKNHKIMEQIFDNGALGYGGKRIIKTKPVLFFFKTTIPIDVNDIDETIWEEKHENILFK